MRAGRSATAGPGAPEWLRLPWRNRCVPRVRKFPGPVTAGAIRAVVSVPGPGAARPWVGSSLLFGRDRRPGRRRGRRGKTLGGVVIAVPVTAVAGVGRCWATTENGSGRR
jgi:hypothetical protein